MPISRNSTFVLRAISNYTVKIKALCSIKLCLYCFSIFFVLVVLPINQSFLRAKHTPMGLITKNCGAMTNNSQYTNTLIAVFCADFYVLLLDSHRVVIRKPNSHIGVLVGENCIIVRIASLLNVLGFVEIAFNLTEYYTKLQYNVYGSTMKGGLTNFFF